MIVGRISAADRGRAVACEDFLIEFCGTEQDGDPKVAADKESRPRGDEVKLTDRINRIQISPTAAVITAAEQLKAKGVVFKGEPKEQFYGIEAIITDGCGNWFSMTQPKEM